MRYKNRLSYRVKLEDDVLGDSYIPALVLQPLLENAVLHGLTAKLNAGDMEAVLSVGGRVEEGQLVLSVHDNGRGIAGDRLPLVMQPGQTDSEDGGVCIGLKNIHDRIILLFGPLYGVSIASREDEYTLVELKLPLLRGEKDAQAFNS